MTFEYKFSNEYNIGLNDFQRYISEKFDFNRKLIKFNQNFDKT